MTGPRHEFSLRGFHTFQRPVIGKSAPTAAALTRTAEPMICRHTEVPHTFGPAYTAGYPVCSSATDTFNGAVPHLNARDVTFTCISRAPLEKLHAYKQRMGWSFLWASSYGNDYNFDLEISRPEEATREFLAGGVPRPPPGWRRSAGPNPRHI